MINKHCNTDILRDAQARNQFFVRHDPIGSEACMIETRLAMRDLACIDRDAGSAHADYLLGFACMINSTCTRILILNEHACVVYPGM